MPTNDFTNRLRLCAAYLTPECGEVAAPVLAAAQLYGVEVVLYLEESWSAPRPKYKWTAGPVEGGVSPKHNAMRVDCNPKYWGGQERAVYLHELTHLLCAHPKLGVLCPEDYLQLQFENQLAKALGFGDCPEHMEFQLGGPAYFNHPLHDSTRDIYPRPEDMHATLWWGQGVERAKLAGLLDSQGLPTGAPLDWKKLRREDLSPFIKGTRI